MLKDYFEAFVMLEKQETEDGYGGVVTERVATDEFLAGISTASSSEQLIAQQTGKIAQFHIITDNKVLKQHDEIKRLKTGLIYRITSDSTDKIAPSKTFQYMQANAERIDL